jgi:hypothetical protein
VQWVEIIVLVFEVGFMGALSYGKTAPNSKNSEIDLWIRLIGVETKIQFRLASNQKIDK